MILVDTSIWVDHLRHDDAALRQLLEAGRVLVHPFVIGELALGHLRQRGPILAALQDLPCVPVATDAEILIFIERHRLSGLGIGYVGVHLLASAQLASGARLWTRDKRLQTVAQQHQWAADPVTT